MKVRVRLTKGFNTPTEPGVEMYGLHLLQRPSLDAVFAPMTIPDNPLTRRMQSLNYRLTSWQWPEVLADRLRVGDTDVVYCWDERQGVPSVVLGGPPVVTGVIWATEPAARASDKALARRYLRRARWVLPNSTGQIPALEGEYGLRGSVRYVRFGIDEAAFPSAPADPDTQIIASIGNDRHRDYETLIRAVAAVQVRVPGARLELLTPEPVDVPVHIGRWIRHGSGTSATELLGRSALVAIPTMPNLHCSGLTVSLEAMATGRAVVATATPGMDDYIAAGETGELVAPGDTTGLASAMGDLLQDRDRLVAFGQAGRRKLETDDLTWDGLSDRIADVLESAQ